MRFGYWLVHRFVYFLIKIIWGLKVRGRKNVPVEGPVIIASNHISFLDPPILGVSIPREAHFAAKEELFKNILLGRLIAYLNAFPVKRSGFDNAALKNSLKALKNGGALIMFPEGTRSRTKDLLPFKRGIGYVVSKTKAVVIPVYIKGSNRLKHNIFTRNSISVFFGNQLSDLADKYPGKEGFEAIARVVREEIIKMKKLADA